MNAHAKVLIISVAARLAGMHPQTLRQYDRLGLVEAGRAPGGGRRYSARDVDVLREIQRLSQEEGVNLAGIKRIIDLENMVDELRHRLAATEAALAESERRGAEFAALHPGFARRAVVPSHETALVVWRPRRSPESR
ncbi:heat shock protein transcriptional repressor HspR [Longispora sp. NPDC051575]|uniref:heat shock protein transcriptional repressor HspR n=1 Tax=Longispora sp. NPDC051575 TaxID=3154943 RepID=UPI00342BEAF3